MRYILKRIDTAERQILAAIRNSRDIEKDIGAVFAVLRFTVRVYLMGMQ